MDSSTRNHSLRKVKVLLCFLIIAGMMAAGKKVKCMATGNSAGVMDLPTKVSINTAANTAKALSPSPPKNTIGGNGCMASRTARVSSTTNKVA